MIYNNNNKLLNTIGEMDDRHIRENELAELDDSLVSAKRRPKKLRILMIAAAAAVLSMLVGFTTAEIVKNTIIVEGVGQMKLDLYKQDITIVPKEELSPDKDTCLIDIPTDELFAKFGVEPIMTDNFSYEVTPTEQWHTCDDEGNVFPVNICLPSVKYYDDCISFEYCVYDKNLDKNVRIHALYPTVDDFNVSFVIEKEEGHFFGTHELIKLNDGSDCHLSYFGGAHFAHDGVYYYFWGDENMRDFDIETQKQIMRDFGLL